MQVILAPGRVRRDLVEFERKGERSRAIEILSEVAKSSKDPLAGSPSGLEITTRADPNNHMDVTGTRVAVRNAIVFSRLRARSHPAQGKYSGPERRFVDSID